ncbi:SCO3374 family protein [Streptomyces sp. NPDC054829]|nr:SCO3374 family protein [Streptomyces sp. SBE_14.2]
MVGSLPPGTPQVTAVPPPRRPLEASDQVRRWYENELGWPTVPGNPPGLRLGLRFDVLDVPAEAGRAALRHLAPGSPVAVKGDRMRLLVAAGSAEELPGVLSWLQWGSLPLDLTVTGEGGVMRAPALPGSGATVGPGPGSRESAGGRPGTPQGVAVWLRPPEPGCEVEASLPTLSALGGGGGAPDLVRLLDTVATHCHRLRLRRVRRQPLAFS